MEPTGTILAHGPADPDGPLMKTYDVNIFGKTVFTTVTPFPDAVHEWIDNIRSTHVNSTSRLSVALDIEQGSAENRIGTLQLCVKCRCLIYQIAYISHVPDTLLNFLSDRNITFVGISIISKIRRLQKTLPFESTARYEDLGNLVAHWYGQPELHNRSLREFSSMVLAKPLEFQEMDNINWNPLELSDSQVLYACVSTFVVFEIKTRLTARIQVLNVNPNTPQKTYNVFYHSKIIRTTVTAYVEPVHDWLTEIISMYNAVDKGLVIGLDVEPYPLIDRDRLGQTIGILQLCVFDRCLIYQIHHSEVHSFTLERFFSDMNVNFVGLSIKSKLDILVEDFNIGIKAQYYDLGRRAAEHYNRPELENAGPVEVGMAVLNRDVEKPTCSTYWYGAKLTEEQVLYAGIDGYLSFEIGRALMKQIRS